MKFDAYMRPDGADDYLAPDEMRPGSFDGVITCSVFEYLIGGADVDKVLGLLADHGTFCLHTLVCEEVPRDPDWFYISAATHCTIWTNMAMGILYHRSGFVGCAYHVGAQMWFFFRDRPRYERLLTSSQRIAGEWAMSDDFVDYWKVRPYRN